jgi:protein-disulfide isomerase
MSKKAWIVFVVIVVVLLGGLVYLSSRNKIDVSNVDVTTIQPASAASGNIADHVFGNSDSKVKLVEYGDFQCPGCGSVYPTLKTLSEKYQGQIAFIFRNFPLTTIHPNARAAAAAA